jgi:hypothetical protein
MRSAAVFFSKRHAIRAGQGSRSADAKSRRSSVAIPRADRRAALRPARAALPAARAADARAADTARSARLPAAAHPLIAAQYGREHSAHPAAQLLSFFLSRDRRAGVAVPPISRQQVTQRVEPKRDSGSGTPACHRGFETRILAKILL